jgi:CheY-like chemotaxis protein
VSSQNTLRGDVETSPRNDHGDPDDRSSLRLLVVDDHVAYRSAVSDCLAIHEAVADVEQADSVREALAAMERSLPDLVVMDVHMPITNGIDGAIEVVRRYPNVRVALCSTSGAHELPELGRVPFESGRVIFVEKGDLEPDSLISWFIETDPPLDALDT